MEKTNIFKCKPPEVHFTIEDGVPYNKLLTNLACSSRTVEYWPSDVFVRTSLRLVRTATTSGQHSPVRPSRSVSKRLLFIGINAWIFYFYVLQKLNPPSLKSNRVLDELVKSFVKVRLDMSPFITTMWCGLYSSFIVILSLLSHFLPWRRALWI